MKRCSFLVAVLSAATSLSACGSVLHDSDFESDRVGRHPSMTRPGTPEGDMITLYAEDDNAIVVEEGITGKGLLYGYAPHGMVVFVGREFSSGVDTYWASWTGRAHKIGPSERLVFRVGNADSGFAQLTIEDGRFRAGGARLYDTVALGDVVEDEDHTVIVRVDNVEGTYRATMFQPGENLSTGNRPLALRGFVTENAYMIRLFYDTVSAGAGEASYVIDNVRITGEQPAMM